MKLFACQKEDREEGTPKNSPQARGRVGFRAEGSHEQPHEPHQKSREKHERPANGFTRLQGGCVHMVLLAPKGININ